MTRRSALVLLVACSLNLLAGCLDGQPHEEKDSNRGAFWVFDEESVAKRQGLDVTEGERLEAGKAFAVNLAAANDYAILGFAFPDLAQTTTVVLDVVVGFIDANGTSQETSTGSYVMAAGFYRTSSRMTFGNQGMSLAGNQFVSSEEPLAGGRMTFDYRRALTADDGGYTSHELGFAVLYKAPAWAQTLIVQFHARPGPADTAYPSVDTLLASWPSGTQRPVTFASGAGSNWIFAMDGLSPTQGRVPALARGINHSVEMTQQLESSKYDGIRKASGAVMGSMAFVHSELAFGHVAASGNWSYSISLDDVEFGGDARILDQPLVPGLGETLDPGAYTGWYFQDAQSRTSLTFQANFSFEAEVGGFILAQTFFLPIELGKITGLTVVAGNQHNAPSSRFPGSPGKIFR